VNSVFQLTTEASAAADDPMFGARSQQQQQQDGQPSMRRHRTTVSSSPTPSTSSLLPHHDASVAESGGFGQQNEATTCEISQAMYRQGGRLDVTEKSLLLDPSQCQGQGHGDAVVTAAAAAAPIARRRAVDSSDLRQCALVQTKMKTWKPGLVVVLVYLTTKLHKYIHTDVRVKALKLT